MKIASIQKWRWIYSGIALLNLTVVGASLALNHHLRNQYSETITLDDFFNKRLKMIEELQVLASAVNAPGNDIFDSNNISLERSRYSAAVKKYDDSYRQILEDLKSYQTKFSFLKVSGLLENIQPNMLTMQKEIEHVFTHVELKKKNLAIGRMAAMDRNLALINQGLIACSLEIRKLQTEYMNRHKDESDRFQYFERVVSFFVFLIILGMVFYGSLISNFVAKALEDRNLALQQKKAIDDSAIVAGLDSAGKIIHVNDKFIDITGYSKAELLGKDYRLINSGHHSKEFFRNISKSVSDGNVWRGEIKDKKKDGSYYWADSSIVPMRDVNGNIFQYMVIRYDITERKELEASLIKSKNEAESAAKVKAEFLANMSHEIRTPMNGIIGMSNLLLSSVTDAANIERLKIIQNCGNTLLDLINDVLDFSKLEVDKVGFESQPFPLHTTVKEVLDLLSTRSSEKGLKLIYQPESNVPEWVSGDVTRFRQILTNLIGNSIKFTENGSVQIFSQVTPLQDHKYKIEFSIKDTGIGISDDVKDRLFQSFSQVDASTTRKFGGSGLGLAICKGLCEKMGGTIWVQSEPGKGSTFFFNFIAEVSMSFEYKTPANPFLAFDTEMGKKHPLRILIVEDSRTNQLVAVGFLQKLGYRADIAANGQEALDCLKRQEYDLVLMDCHMPVMDGFEATKRIVAKYAEAERPQIIALTASTMKKDIDLCKATGMNGIIGKPITIAALVKSLSNCKARDCNIRKAV